METNWIIIALVFICAIALIIFLVIRNQKDKDDVIESLNDSENIDNVTENERDID